jgi:hypothetical protein
MSCEGDTLWDISARFLRDPWRWPDIWGLNKDQIKNPTGSTRRRDPGFTSMTPRAGRHRRRHRLASVVTKLSPSIRNRLAASAIPSIPVGNAPFLTKPLVVGRAKWPPPILVAGQENRVVLRGRYRLRQGRGLGGWRLEHIAQAVVDPGHKLLGREAVHLGELKVSQFGEVSRVAITKSVLEIAPGDRVVKIMPMPVVSHSRAEHADKRQSDRGPAQQSRKSVRIWLWC